MMMRRPAMSIILSCSLFLSLATAATARPDWPHNPIRLNSDDSGNGNGVVGAVEVKNCESWRLAVETNNARTMKVVPEQCVGYVGEYMMSKISGQEDRPFQYTNDTQVVVALALEYLTTLTPNPDGKDIWLFALTNTLLSDLAYYNRDDVRFGATPYNETKYNEWYAKKKFMPPIPLVMDLYNAVKSKGFKIVILSGLLESLRSSVESYLYYFPAREKLILRNDSKTTIGAFKRSARAQLSKDGYRVVGYVGDQWSDFQSGNNAEMTIFKLPNPMRYVPST